MYFGREKELQRIIEYCKAGRPVVLSSRPGLGATTLLRHGVAPALRKVGFIVIELHAWQGKLFRIQLAEEIAKSVREQADESFIAQPEPLSEMLVRIRSVTGRPAALLLDQFEDYLRCHPESTMFDGFDAEFADAISSGDSRIVIAIQDHGLNALHRLEQLVPDLMASHVKLGPLEEAAAREAVAAAGGEAGIEFEPDVIDALVRSPDVSYADGVHPFYLMTGVQRLLGAGGTGKTVNKAMFEVCGGADRLVRQSFDGKLSRLNTAQIDLFFRWCSLLLSPDGERLARTVEELNEHAGRLNRFAESLLPILLEEGILRKLETPSGMRYEIARDSLTPLVRDWWVRRQAIVVARDRAQFRMRSISLAVGLIAALYVVWLLSLGR